MTNKQHATRIKKMLAGEVVEYTNLRDERGILIELTSHDIERLGAEGVREYRQHRDQEIAAARAQREEKERFETYKQRYIAAGGSASGAAEAYKAFRAQQAAEADARSDEHARAAYAADIRAAI
jgi:hypothetical protein